MTIRKFLVAALAVASAGALGPATAQAVPKLPDTTAGAKRCATTRRLGYTIRVYVTKGKGLSCRRARSIMARTPMKPVKGYRYYDWTKGGNGPWSDVWVSTSGRTIIAGIIRA